MQDRGQFPEIQGLPEVNISFISALAKSDSALGSIVRTLSTEETLSADDIVKQIVTKTMPNDISSTKATVIKVNVNSQVRWGLRELTRAGLVRFNPADEVYSLVYQPPQNSESTSEVSKEVIQTIDIIRALAGNDEKLRQIVSSFGTEPQTLNAIQARLDIPEDDIITKAALQNFLEETTGDGIIISNPDGTYKVVPDVERKIKERQRKRSGFTADIRGEIWTAGDLHAILKKFGVKSVRLVDIFKAVDEIAEHRNARLRKLDEDIRNNVWSSSEGTEQLN